MMNVHKRGNTGFTLIELMIVVVIIAILAAVAYPSYRNQVMESRRSDATAALNHAAMQMEACRAEKGTYSGCAPSLTRSEHGYYDITVKVSSNGKSYVLTAKPGKSSPQSKDKKCKTLTLASDMSHGFTGTASSVKECWNG